MADGEYPNGGDFKKTLQIVSQPNHIRPVRKKVPVVVLKDLVISLSVNDILTTPVHMGCPLAHHFLPNPTRPSIVTM